MAKINLRDIFPFYTIDCFVEVPDGEEKAFTECLTKTIADVFVEFQCAESVYQRKQSRYKAYYSLDQDDGIENTIISVIGKPTPSTAALCSYQQFTGKTGKAHIRPLFFEYEQI